MHRVRAPKLREMGAWFQLHALSTVSFHGREHARAIVSRL